MIKILVKRNKMASKSSHLKFDNRMIYYVEKGVILSDKIKQFLWRCKR